MATEPGIVTVKGSPVKSLLKFVDGELTAQQRDQIYGALPAEYAERFRSGMFLVSETLPVSILNRLTESAAKIKGEPVESFARRAGRAAASDALSGVYRLFAMVLTPTALLSKATNIWTSLYSRGELKVESQSEKGARLMLLNFPSEAVGCARISGWIERMTELTGAKNPRVTHTACVAKGAKQCEWDLYWGDLKEK